MPARANLPHDEIAGLYRAGMPIPEIARHFKCSERAVRYVARKYKLPGRRGIERPMRGPFETAHPAMRDLFAKAVSEGWSLRALAKRSGVSRESLNKWARHRCGPEFFALIATGEALGLELTWRRKVS